MDQLVRLVWFAVIAHGDERMPRENAFVNVCQRANKGVQRVRKPRLQSGFSPDCASFVSGPDWPHNSADLARRIRDLPPAQEQKQINDLLGIFELCICNIRDQRLSTGPAAG